MNRSRCCLMAVLVGTASLVLSACSDGPVVLRSQADRHIEASSSPDDSTDAQCASLRDQIRADREAAREAPTTSTSPEIVAAAQGQADKRADDLGERLDLMGCNDHPAAVPADDRRLPPMQPAPNAPNR